MGVRVDQARDQDLIGALDFGNRIGRRTPLGSRHDRRDPTILDDDRMIRVDRAVGFHWNDPARVYRLHRVHTRTCLDMIRVCAGSDFRAVEARVAVYMLPPDSATLHPGYVRQVAWMERSGIRDNSHIGIGSTVPQRD